MVPPKDSGRTSARRDSSGLKGARLPFQGATPTIHQHRGTTEPAEEEAVEAPALEAAGSPSADPTPSVEDGEGNKTHPPLPSSETHYRFCAILACANLMIQPKKYAVSVTRRVPLLARLIIFFFFLLVP